MALKWPWQRTRDAAPPQPAPNVAVNDNARRGRFAGDGIVNVASGLGMQQDHNASSFYAPVIPLNLVQLESMYRGSWLPRRIVDTKTEDMTRAWISRTWDGHDNDKDGPRKITTEERRLNVQGMTTEALRWGSLFGGAGVILGIKNQPLDQPLDVTTVGKGDLQWLAVSNRWYLTNAESYISEPGPMMGYPEFYRLVDVVGSSGGARVHHSRVIRFGGDKLPTMSWLANARWDDSVLQSPYNVIKRYDGMAGGIASLIWEAKTDVLSIENLKELLSMEGGEQELQKRFAAVSVARTLFNVLLLDKADEYDRKEIHFAGLKDLIVEARTEVAGAARMPITKLWGESPGGLNATGQSDMATYYDDINAAQTSDMRPSFSRLDEVVVRSALGTLPEQYEFTFNHLSQVDKKDQAAVDKMDAETAKIYFDMGAVAASLVARTLREKRTYPPMQDEDVALVEAMEAEPEEHDPKSGAPLKEGAEEDPSEKTEKADGGEAETKDALTRAMKALDATQLQSFIFTKPQFTAERAQAWLKRNGKSTAGGVETGESFRYRQEEPGDFEIGSFRTIPIAPGVYAVIGHPKRKNDGRDVVTRRKFQDFNIAVENPAGSLRHWYDSDGNERGTTAMRADYGFFEDHLGSDGEELDAYLGPHETAKNVYVVHQLKRPAYQKADEDKVILGVFSAEHAREIYASHRDDGDRAIGSMAEIPVETFRAQLKRRTGTGKIRS